MNKYVIFFREKVKKTLKECDESNIIPKTNEANHKLSRVAHKQRESQWNESQQEDDSTGSSFLVM